MYDWWKAKILEEIQVGHRYFAVMALAIYARKCNIGEDELRHDAYEVLEAFERLTNSDENHFTVDDIEAALGQYNENYITFPRREIARLTNLEMPANKRNGRKQAAHLQRARAVQSVDYPNGEWRNKSGRPPVKEKIKQYLRENPLSSKAQIRNDLGLSYPTIRKYYDIICDELKEENEA